MLSEVVINIRLVVQSDFKRGIFVEPINRISQPFPEMFFTPQNQTTMVVSQHIGGVVTSPCVCLRKGHIQRHSRYNTANKSFLHLCIKILNNILCSSTGIYIANLLIYNNHYMFLRCLFSTKFRISTPMNTEVNCPSVFEAFHLVLFHPRKFLPQNRQSSLQYSLIP